MGKRTPEGDRAVVLVLVVLRRPHLIVELEGFLLVVGDRRRRYVGAAGPRRLLERGQKHKRLEHGSRLTTRQDRAVVLRLYVGANPGERENLAGARVERDQRR